MSRAARDLLASALLFASGRFYLRRARTGNGSDATAAAVIYLLLYVAVLSLWAIDLIMSLHEWAPSTVVPPYYFMGAFLAAIALAALAESVGREDPSGAATRQDLGKLLFAMVIMWGYLLWSAYLPVWYGNMPDETGQLLARWDGGWKIVTLGMLAAVLVFPFFSCSRSGPSGAGRPWRPLRSASSPACSASTSSWSCPRGTRSTSTCPPFCSAPASRSG